MLGFRDLGAGPKVAFMLPALRQGVLGEATSWLHPGGQTGAQFGFRVQGF